MDSGQGFSERGEASWYGPKFHGRRTSSGEPYDMYKMTAAHKHLPLPSYVQVTNLDNGRQVVVRVNDRGPFKPGRVIDLSYAAATKLDMVRSGTARVEIRVLDPDAPRRKPPPDGSPTRLAAGQLPGSDGFIYLQAGAFASQNNADSLRGRLRDAIDPLVTVNTSPDPARPLYRVRLGPLESVEQAMRLAAELDRLGVNGARVIID
jgi:rare lipoprotein A